MWELPECLWEICFVGNWTQSLMNAKQTLFQLSCYVCSPAKSTEERQRDGIEPTLKNKTWKTESKEETERMGEGAKLSTPEPQPTIIPQKPKAHSRHSWSSSLVFFLNRKCNQSCVYLYLLVKPSILKTRTLLMNSHSRLQPQTSEGRLPACNVHEPTVMNRAWTEELLLQKGTTVC